MRQGPDRPTPCVACNDSIYPSQVATTYTTAERMYYFVSGICKSCQRKDATGESEI